MLGAHIMHFIQKIWHTTHRHDQFLHAQVLIIVQKYFNYVWSYSFRSDQIIKMAMWIRLLVQRSRANSRYDLAKISLIYIRSGVIFPHHNKRCKLKSISAEKPQTVDLTLGWCIILLIQCPVINTSLFRCIVKPELMECRQFPLLNHAFESILTRQRSLDWHAAWYSRSVVPVMGVTDSGRPVLSLSVACDLWTYFQINFILV